MLCIYIHISSGLPALCPWLMALRFQMTAVGKAYLKPIGFKLIREIPLSSISTFPGGDGDQAVNHQQ